MIDYRRRHLYLLRAGWPWVTHCTLSNFKPKRQSRAFFSVRFHSTGVFQTVLSCTFTLTTSPACTHSAPSWTATQRRQRPGAFLRSRRAYRRRTNTASFQTTRSWSHLTRYVAFAASCSRYGSNDASAKSHGLGDGMLPPSNARLNGSNGSEACAALEASRTGLAGPVSTWAAIHLEEQRGARYGRRFFVHNLERSKPSHMILVSVHARLPDSRSPIRPAASHLPALASASLSGRSASCLMYKSTHQCSS